MKSDYQYYISKLKGLTIMVLCLINLLSCKDSNQDDLKINKSVYRSLFMAQINEVDPNLKWIKTVNDKDKKIFMVNNNPVIFNDNNGSKTNLVNELSSAVEIMFDDAKSVEYFDVVKDNQNIEAIIKKGFENKTRLQRQSIKISPQTNKIVQWSSKLRSDTWIYNSDIQINVMFDSSGHYKSHSLEYQNHSPYLGMEYKTKISGYLTKSN